MVRYGLRCPVKVLIIYPYWILNAKQTARLDVEALTYNLSILDFKCQLIELISSYIFILIIYPYWILNIGTYNFSELTKDL